MKASVDRSTTARVLADIADAVRPVERARTAAAHEDGGVPEAYTTCFDDCPQTEEHYDALVSMASCNATPGLARLGADGGALRRLLEDQRVDYAPWNVSPHLFGEDDR